MLGRPMYFATAHPFPTGAIPVLVKSDAFRPIKIEGNPDHPMAKGKSDATTQGTLLDLYDPDRSHAPRFRGTGDELPVVPERAAGRVLRVCRVGRGSTF